MTAVTLPGAASASASERPGPRPSARTSGRWAWLRERGMGASVLVAAISGGFGVLLVAVTGLIGAWLMADPFLSGGETIIIVVAILSVLLVAVAMYVAAIVTANTFATIVAGRTRQIALMRLIGASARSQRSRIARQGLIVGAIGAVIGLIGGTAAAAGLQELAARAWGLNVDYSIVQPVLLAPALVVALTTWVAAWAGSRRVLEVTPLAALAGSAPRTAEAAAGRTRRRVTAVSLFAVGAVLLALGILAGFVTPLGVVVAFFGGLASFTGLSLGAALVMPPLLRLTGRLFGRSASARLAAENALRYPERSSRMAIGVVMGVTLVTMFAVASESVKGVMAASGGGEVSGEMARLLDTFSAVMMALVGVSAVIAAVGLVNLLTIGVVQRTRELGLLRALGLTGRQIRSMVLFEAAHITITSVVFGLLLGIAYGWAAAQSLLGSVRVPPLWLAPNFVLPGIPWLTVAGIVVATAVLTLVAAVVPTRLATRVSPVEALAE
ncbi:peptide ABC transporter permease [Microbacterium sp. SGAir0570]|uniref:ABC transporter permease n=1 Tax=Microbacterium sp. SGAir0570 TaxID=2070348 RepID=UPI0010CCFC09|nr:ABC transporter permease [Microbacterium sp. SGAir0570]QCR41465.1 peptide ABC transporter permease [Microbacterium sp. SGAir0570]